MPQAERLRILMLVHNAGKVGDYYRAWGFARELARRAHAVTLIYARSEQGLRAERTCVDGVEIIAAPRMRTPLPRFLSHTRSPSDLLMRCGHVLTTPYDVYHAFAPKENTGFPWLLARRLYPRRVFVFDQCDLYVDGGFRGPRPSEPGARRRFYDCLAALDRGLKRRADAVTVISTALADRAIAQGVASERVFHIVSGAPVDVIAPLPGEEARQRLGIHVQGPLLGYSAFAQDDLPELLQALRWLADHQPDIHLMVIGPQSPIYDHWVDVLQLQEQVFCVGVIPYSSLGMYLAAATALVLPYPDTIPNQARWPNKLGDYLCAGRPVVTGSAGDVGPFVQRHGVGLTYSGGAEGMAACILRLLENRDLLDEMGARARRVAELELPWARQALRLEEVY